MVPNIELSPPDRESTKQSHKIHAREAAEIQNPGSQFGGECQTVDITVSEFRH